MTTVVSDFHAKVMKWVENQGIGVQEEVDFPPYRVDIYLPDFHAAVEVDGPQHAEKRDARRDNLLGRQYQLVVFHIPIELFNNKKQLTEEFIMFTAAAAYSAEERIEKVKDRIPWI